MYGSREGQAVAFVPLDNRLQLPAGPFSYLLQGSDQALAVEQLPLAHTVLQFVARPPQTVLHRPALGDLRYDSSDVPADAGKGL